MKLTADSETPLRLFKTIQIKASFSFESVVGGEQVSRFSFLGFSSSKPFHASKIILKLKIMMGRISKFNPDDPLKLIEDEIEEPDIMDCWSSVFGGV